MTEPIAATWNDERDAAFDGITDTLTAIGSSEDTALLATGVYATADAAVQIDKMLADLLVAESWESMALRSAAGSKPRHRNLVPVPIAAHRRAA